MMGHPEGMNAASFGGFDFWLSVLRLILPSNFGMDVMEGGNPSE